MRRMVIPKPARRGSVPARWRSAFGSSRPRSWPRPTRPKTDGISGGNFNQTDPVGLLKAKLPSGSWNNAGAVADLFLGFLFPAEGKANLDEYRTLAINFLNTTRQRHRLITLQLLGNTTRRLRHASAGDGFHAHDLAAFSGTINDSRLCNIITSTSLTAATSSARWARPASLRPWLR